MKAVVLCFVVLLAVVCSERCSDRDDCTVTSCSNGDLHCVDGGCTCATHTDSVCTSWTQCHNICSDHRPHTCWNGRCMCHH